MEQKQNTEQKLALKLKERKIYFPKILIQNYKFSQINWRITEGKEVKPCYKQINWLSLLRWNSMTPKFPNSTAIDRKFWGTENHGLEHESDKGNYWREKEDYLEEKGSPRAHVLGRRALYLGFHSFVTALSLQRANAERSSFRLLVRKE